MTKPTRDSEPRAQAVESALIDLDAAEPAAPEAISAVVPERGSLRELRQEERAQPLLVLERAKFSPRSSALRQAFQLQPEGVPSEPVTHAADRSAAAPVAPRRNRERRCVLRDRECV